MNPEAQIWKDRYFALKKWVEGNVPPESQRDKEESQRDKEREYNLKEAAYYDARALIDSNPNVSIGTAGDWNDFWESREK